MLVMESPSSTALDAALLALSPSMPVPKHLDEETITWFVDSCQMLLREQCHTWLILDFTKTETISESGLNAFSLLGKLAMKHNICMLGTHLSEGVERELCGAGADMYIRIEREEMQLLAPSRSNWGETLTRVREGSFS